MRELNEMELERVAAGKELSAAIRRDADRITAGALATADAWQAAAGAVAHASRNASDRVDDLHRRLTTGGDRR